MKKIMQFGLFSAAVCALFVATSANAMRPVTKNGVWLFDTLHITPSVTLSYMHDSNPESARDGSKKIMEEHGVWTEGNAFSLRPVIDFRVPGANWSIDGQAYYRMISYAEDEIDDRDYYGESVAFYGSTDGGWRWSLREKFEQLTYDALDFYSLDDRSELTVFGSIGKQLTEKTGMSIRGNFRLLDYDEPLLYDNESYSAGIDFSHYLTEKSDMTLSFGWQGWKTDRYSHPSANTALGETASQYDVQVGVATRSTEKLRFRASVGAGVYSDYYDETSTDFAYSLGSTWFATDRLNFTLSGSSGYDTSSSAALSYNYYQIALGSNYSIFDNIVLSGGVSFRIEDYIEGYTLSDGSEADRDVDCFSAYFKFSCKVNKHASISAGVDWSTEDNSTFDTLDYERITFNVGMALRY